MPEPQRHRIQIDHFYSLFFLQGYEEEKEKQKECGRLETQQLKQCEKDHSFFFQKTVSPKNQNSRAAVS
jgi:hypothetical protein